MRHCVSSACRTGGALSPHPSMTGESRSLGAAQRAPSSRPHHPKGPKVEARAAHRGHVLVFYPLPSLLDRAAICNHRARRAGTAVRFIVGGFTKERWSAAAQQNEDDAPRLTSAYATLDSAIRPLRIEGPRALLTTDSRA